MFLIIVIFCGIWMLVRNKSVFDYRKNLLEKISKAAKKDIKNGKDWTWRYRVLETVTYNEMMWKFWKSLDSFYSNKSFIT